MSARAPLVDIAKLRTLLEGLHLGDNNQRNVQLEARWLNYVEWWDGRAAEAKWKYLGLRSTVIIGSALIPALVAMRELATAPMTATVAVASIVVSFLVAVAAGLESLFGYGEIWREKRTAAEVIKSEGFSFMQLVGKYADFKTHADAYPAFAANVEDLILKEIKDYIVAVGPKPSDGKGGAAPSPQRP